MKKSNSKRCSTDNQKTALLLTCSKTLSILQKKGHCTAYTVNVKLCGNKHC